ncbi:hypothetical protein GJ744_005951 [Endocarpon pusillum]|uniref:Uncharacterized protein n=1 Tax=Endocarpon pusillum TaxID=364733 RepID=A0A8H7E8K9_9EURO|nr:hypothetical protein GJ744_005951 [Endocarpon pusillum]
MRARRSLRPILENLESLRLEFYGENSFNNYWGQRGRDRISNLRDVQRFLKTQRGPYRKLVRAFKSAKQHYIWRDERRTWNLRLRAWKREAGKTVDYFCTREMTEALPLQHQTRSLRRTERRDMPLNCGSARGSFPTSKAYCGSQRF